MTGTAQRRHPRPAAPAAGIRSRWRASACRRCSPAARLAERRFSRRARAGAVRRHGRALDPAARATRSRAAFGLVLGILAHAVGWPIARGGSQRIADALAPTCARSAARSSLERRVASLAELPPAGATLLDVTPAAAAAAWRATACPRATAGSLSRYRYGPGVFKLDWALDGPIPGGAGPARGGHGPPRRHAGRDRRVASARSGRGGHPSGPSCCWRSRACSTRRARRRASTPSGPTATSPTARRST